MLFRENSWLELNKTLIESQKNKKLFAIEISTNDFDGIILWYSIVVNKNNTTSFSIIIING